MDSRKISEVRLEVKPPTSSEEDGGPDIPDDPWCDDLNPRICNFENISAAAYKIRDGIVRTPCDVRNILFIMQILCLQWFHFKLKK